MFRIPGAVGGSRIIRQSMIVLALILLAPALPVAADAPPDPPVIASPIDRHVPAWAVPMETGAPFRAPHGATHQATDW